MNDNEPQEETIVNFNLNPTTLTISEKYITTHEIN